MPPVKRPAAVEASGAEPLKRPAAAAAASKTIPRAAARCRSVAEALVSASSVPQAFLEALAKNLPGTLGVPPDAREPIQERVVAMVGEILASIEAELQARVAATEAAAGEAAQAQAVTAAAEATALEARNKSKEHLDKVRADLEEAHAAVKTARDTVQESDKANKELEGPLAVAAEQRRRYDAARKDLYTPLKEGSLDPDNVRAALSSLEAFAKAADFDLSLRTSCPSALKKAPSDRGSFDNMVLQQMDGEFDKQIAALDEKISSGKASRVEYETKLEAAAAALIVAGERLSACQAGTKAAEFAKREAEAAFKSARLANKATKENQAIIAHEKAKADLLEFQEGASKDFKELKDPPVEPPAATEEEAPAEPAEPAEDTVTEQPAEGAPAESV